MITSSDDGTVKLWDVKTGEFIRNLVALESGGSGGVVWRIRYDSYIVVVKKKILRTNGYRLPQSQRYKTDLRGRFAQRNGGNQTVGTRLRRRRCLFEMLISSE